MHALQVSALADVRHLIDAARQRVAGTVNAALTQLYWQIGNRVNLELLQGKRAEYGKQVIVELAKQLTTQFGKGWSERPLRYCLRIAEALSRNNKPPQYPQQQGLSPHHQHP
nr:hypothetical protein [Desulfobulbaceae bacterium]